jgi:glycosyltransferase involved in cell wall biosynthesis
VTDRLKIGLTWQLNTYTGWGVFGTNVALALAARKDIDLSFWVADLQGLNALDASLLAPIMQRCNTDVTVANARQQPIRFDGVLVHADGNHFKNDLPRRMVQAERNMGLMVFEDTAFAPDEIERGKRYDWLVTGSRWNQSILKGYGLDSTCIMQGVDPTVFHPAPKSGRWCDRFVVFSGGKLEYRKGQDIVLAAFREFHAKHPEALLVTAWQNQWPRLVCDMTLNGHVEHEPVVAGGEVDIEGWFTDNGIPEGAAMDVGMMPNAWLGQIVREADVAVFMSRAEGGTNLMAMECMAAWVPTIASGNTGHLDLLSGGIPCGGRPVNPTRIFNGIDGWGEVDPRALVERLERQRGDMEARTISSMPTWTEYADQLVDLIRGEHASAAA